MTDLAGLIGDRNISEARRESLRLAVEAGAPTETLVLLRDSRRVARRDTIVLPEQRFEGLSRGRGWCRKGIGAGAVWGERDEKGYRVGPGKWVVGGNDGFSRKGEDRWEVEHVQVGQETWTVAN